MATATLPRTAEDTREAATPQNEVVGPVLDLTVAGILDEEAGRALLFAVTEASEQGWHRVEIDLREVTAHTSQGAAAVAKLCRTGSLLPAGIGFSVAAGASRAALLASLADA